MCLVVEDCTFADNAARDGGALYVSESELDVSGSDFEGNLPTDLYDADLQSSWDLGLDAALHCEPDGCE